MNQIVNPIEFNKTAYFYPDATMKLGSIEKDDCTALMVSVDYSKLGINITSAIFSVDVQTNPALIVSGTTAINNILTFVLSGGLKGITYNLSITGTPATRTDVLTIFVPEDIGCNTSVQANNFNFVSQNATIYVNGSPRFFIANIPPVNANIMDQWYYPPTGALYEYITSGDGVNFWWQRIALYSPPSVPIGGISLYQEQLSVTSVNTLSALSHAPIGPVTLFINGAVFNSVTVPAPFTVSGNTITWISTITSLLPGYTTVVASYTG